MLFQIKTKGWPPNAQNKKRSCLKAELEESSTYWDPLRFKYDVDQVPQITVENGRVSRGGKVAKTNRDEKTSKNDRSKKIEKVERDKKGSKTAENWRISRTNLVGSVRKARGERNKYVITNKLQARGAEIA